jgi:broad specificity phosphatase PhoE
MTIYMSRHGESLNNVLNIIGGDCHLSERGKKYNKFLCNFFVKKKISVWTSSLKRTKETAIGISDDTITCVNLNEIDSGNFDGLTIDNIKTNYPLQYKIRNDNKLSKSYPNGESYLDLQERVISVLKYIDMSLNTSLGSNLLIIGHQAVCRVIYSYFTQIPLEECINTKIELHTLYEFGCNNFMPILSNIQTC